MRKLNEKEEKEVVTKGFLIENEYVTKTSLEEILDSKNYVTKDYLEEVLEKKNYVTKDYLDIVIKKQTEDYHQYLDGLMEHHMNNLQSIFETFDVRYVTRKEWDERKMRKYIV